MKDPKVNKEITKLLTEAALKLKQAINTPNKYNNLPDGALDKIVKQHVELATIIKEMNSFYTKANKHIT